MRKSIEVHIFLTKKLKKISEYVINIPNGRWNMYTKSIIELIINKSIEYRNLTQNDEYYTDYYSLNRLVYIAHGITLALYNRNLIDVNILATSIGPRVEDADYIFLDWGANPIIEVYDPIPAPPEFMDIIDIVVKQFGPMNRFELGYLCKQHPYFNKSLKRGDMQVVQNEEIKNYFLSKNVTSIMGDYHIMKPNANLRLILASKKL